MWSDLSRCSMLIGWLCLGMLQAELTAQERMLAPTSIVDPIPDNRFLDDQPTRPNSFGTSPLSLSVISPGTLDRLHSPILRQDLKINGAKSCATSNCHGGPRPGVSQPSASRGMEYQLWIENDPHAQSWRTIASDESVAMMRRLKIMDGDEIVDQVGFDNCLACHNSTKRYNEPRRNYRSGKLVATIEANASPSDVNSFLREGVGCSGCHGPSEQWAEEHFQYHWSPYMASEQGFVEAGDLYVRARMCASCHVGDKDRDMNHDIIAAGHPTLRYELATLHAWQPKHWRDPEADDRTYYEAQLWLAGQVGATDASLALLQSRAGNARSVSEWPEFAAYDCASCHHNLGLNNARRPLAENRDATAIYSQWNDAGLRWVIGYRMETGQAIQEDWDLLAALDQVKQQMHLRPKPNPRAVAQATTDARIALAAWFDGRPGHDERAMFRSDRLGQVVASAAGKRDSFQTWESAVQFYLAAVAARESWPGGWHGPLRNVADQMQNQLRYPDMIDVSRYAKRGGQGPTATPVQAMQLGIELAGWLGPVQPEMTFDEQDDQVVTQQLRGQLNRMLQEINQRWRGIADKRAADARQADANDDGMDDVVNKRVPERKPKTREALLEELRKRQEAP